MWSVSYMDLEDDGIKIKGGFKSDKEAIEWVHAEEKEKKIIALKLLVWSEYLQSFRSVLEFTK